MDNIIKVAEKLNIDKGDLELYGDYKSKIKFNGSPKDSSKLILVTAVNPTPYGEGKTTVSIGLNDALCKLGNKSVVVLREPSLGPVFGMKGGATGGGMASVIPSDDINLHFNGDFHAITSANNLLAAAIDNHIYHGNELNLDENRICFKRCLDVNDRTLRGNFNITAASEVMAIFCLANDYRDLRRRLGNILCCYDKSNKPVYAKDLKVDGAMFLLLEKAFLPNLVQTKEANPAIIHGGPFANIAHGCNSVVATKVGLSVADYVVTEAGFGSDLGAEKFIDIKCRKSELKPSFIVLVVTVRANNYNGIQNLGSHIDHLKNYNIPCCVAINKFNDDKEEELDTIINYCHDRDIECFITSSYIDGGVGSIDLAKYILKGEKTDNINYLYTDDMSIADKIRNVALEAYHLNNIEFSEQAKEKLKEIDRLNLNYYPICIAKTQYAFPTDSDDDILDKTLHIKDIIIQTGSEMIIVLTDKIITMPGLPKHPNYESM